MIIVVIMRADWQAFGRRSRRASEPVPRKANPAVQAAAVEEKYEKYWPRKIMMVTLAASLHEHTSASASLGKTPDTSLQ